MSDAGKLKVCLAASAGGHLSQLLKTMPAWREYDYFFVTSGAMVAEKLHRDHGVPVYVVGEANRQHPLKVAVILGRCIRVIARRRPDVVISTGAAPGCLLCLLGKLLGAKVVWIDSIANVARLSLSGRIVRPLADLFLTQWSDLADEEKSIVYSGELV